ncbi:hypothetical protein [Aeromicrobium sp. LTX1]|uniref:hypothetical protein n=1 Tax=Aeromicrobium sp. LTX1 TaxID=3389798 RepID=UPI00396B1037
MLSRIDVLAYLVLAVALVALVLLLTDRSAFAWALAGGGFVGVLAGDLALRAIRRRSRR